MSHVSQSTAIKLKEAGFPQPEAEVGQFWYSPAGVVNVCRYICRSTRGLMSLPPRFVNLGYMDPLLGTLNSAERTYAPSATEILAWVSQIIGGMGKDTEIKVTLTPPGQDWLSAWRGDIIDPVSEQYFDYYHENPAEAIAGSVLDWIAYRNPVLSANP